MHVSLIDIGTSKGIRIPSSVLKMFNSLTSFNLKVDGNKIILDVLESPRKGWDEKFKNSYDDLLIDDTIDAKDWDDL
jgi:antitoxin MazE